VRTKGEEFEFFKQGRVFEMLWTETAGGNFPKSSATVNSSATINEEMMFEIGRFGEVVYSSICRFVIVKVNRRQHFVQAWWVLL
jgi:hypothetical protein